MPVSAIKCSRRQPGKTAPFSLVDRVIAAGLLPDLFALTPAGASSTTSRMATTERIIEGLPEETQKLLQAYSKDVGVSATSSKG